MDARSLARPALAGLLLLTACDGDGAAPPPPPLDSTAAMTGATAPASTSTSSSTSTSTTTTVPGNATVAATCDTLRAAPWPDRRAVTMVNTAPYLAEGGAGPLVEPVRATCPGELARQEASSALEGRSGTVALEDGDLTGIACYDAAMVTTVFNSSVEPIGIVGGARPRSTQGEDDLPADAGVVAWSIPPGESQQLTMSLAQPSQECSFNGLLFLADHSPADAGAPGAPGPATIGDDPATWLPALVQADLDRKRTPTPAGAYDVYDVRKTGHPGTAAEVVPDADVHPLVSVTVCLGTADQPDADHVALAYRTEFGPVTVAGPSGTDAHAGYSTLS